MVRRLSRVTAAIATAWLFVKSPLAALILALATPALATLANAQRHPLPNKQQTSKKSSQRAVPKGAALFICRYFDLTARSPAESDNLS